MFDLTPMLLQSADVPAEARRALQAAVSASPQERRPHLEAAARVLFARTPLSCGEARDLVGLSPGDCE